MILVSRFTPRGYLFPMARPEIETFIAGLLERLGLTGSMVDVQLADDMLSASLNEAWLGLPGPTNVLSFPDQDETSCHGEDADVPPILDEDGARNDFSKACLDNQGDADPDPDRLSRVGGIVLSLETLAREARLYGQDPREHGLRLLCHGLLHCCGLEHGPEMDAITEEALENWRKEEAV